MCRRAGTCRRGRRPPRRRPAAPRGRPTSRGTGPARIIGPIARAGLTPAPLTGPLTTRTGTKVTTASAASTRPTGHPGGRGRGAKVGDRPGLIPVQAPGDRGRGDRAGELGEDVARSAGPWEAPADGQPEGHRRVEVGTGNVAEHPRLRSPALAPPATGTARDP